mmetsp:Transcript_88410/g.245443  ORF Transcript_88410/g.245443 Transcript_88410/m.245443 type:complete len:371 (+) Transcript_88410:567-1679(+)
MKPSASASRATASPWEVATSWTSRRRALSFAKRCKSASAWPAWRRAASRSLSQPSRRSSSSASSSPCEREHFSSSASALLICSEPLRACLSSSKLCRDNPRFSTRWASKDLLLSASCASNATHFSCSTAYSASTAAEPAVSSCSACSALASASWAAASAASCSSSSAVFSASLESAWATAALTSTHGSEPRRMAPGRDAAGPPPRRGVLKPPARGVPGPLPARGVLTPASAPARDALVPAPQRGVLPVVPPPRGAAPAVAAEDPVRRPAAAAGATATAGTSARCDARPWGFSSQPGSTLLPVADWSARHAAMGATAGPAVRSLAAARAASATGQRFSLSNAVGVLSSDGAIAPGSQPPRTRSRRLPRDWE